MSKPIQHFNNMKISCDTHELVDGLFEDSMQMYISESGMAYEYGADSIIENFLDSYSFDEKVMHLLTNNIKIY